MRARCRKKNATTKTIAHEPKISCNNKIYTIHDIQSASQLAGEYSTEPFIETPTYMFIICIFIAI